MPDFTVRSDTVNVEQIMEQIRARIREKRGADYTEEQIHELAAVKLEKFLDPRGVRSDLLEHFRQKQQEPLPPAPPNFAFEDSTLFESHRAPLRWIRRLLGPLLKLFFNPNPLIQALHIQAQINNLSAEREARREAARRELDQLQFEVLHNLVIETTRLSIELKNLKMRVESLTGRFEFNERRARALESVVVYKPAEIAAAVEAPSEVLPEDRPASLAVAVPQVEPAVGPGQRSRRRRRRRGRRGTGPAAALMGAGGSTSGPDAQTAGDPIDTSHDDDTDDDGPEDNRSSSAAAPASDSEPSRFDPESQ